MATQVEEAQNQALVLVEALPIEKLFEPITINPILERIKIEVRAVPTDISTERGRKAVASLAFKIAKTKTFIGDRHDELVSKEKRRLGLIDGEWKRIREDLDALKVEVRKPLTDWEQTEQDRVDAHEHHIGRLESATILPSNATTAQIAERIAELEADDLSQMDEFLKRAMEAKAKALEELRSRHARSVQQDADRAELGRLRVEKEQRDREERERQIAEQATKDAEAKAARQVEEARQSAEKAEKDRVAAVEQAEREKIAAELKAAAMLL